MRSDHQLSEYQSGMTSAVLPLVCCLLLLALLPLSSAARDDLPQQGKIVSERAELLRATAIQLGQSIPRLKANSWADWLCSAQNKSDEMVTFDVNLTPASRNYAGTFQQTITVPPQHRLNSWLPVTASVDSRYRTACYQNGQMVRSSLAGADEIIAQTMPAETRLIWILRDDSDMSFRSLTKGQRGEVKTVAVQSHKIPVHWSGYDSAFALVLLAPDFQKMNQRSIEAIRGYVARGGCVIFADPVTAVEALDSPLADLLPVTPIRVTEVEALSFADLGGKTVEWPLGTPFAQCAIDEDAYVSLYAGDFPLVSWKRYGLGVVGLIAINTSSDELNDSGTHTLLWRHLLAFGGQTTALSSAPAPKFDKALDAMTGVAIPSTNSIAKLIAAYAVALLLLLVAGKITSRRTVAWGSAVVLGGAATALIFDEANRGAAQDRRMQSMIELRNVGTEELCTESFVSLYVQKATSVDISAANCDERLRPLVPLDRSTRLKKNRNMQPRKRKKDAKEKREEPGATRAHEAGTGIGLRDPLLLTFDAGRLRLRETELRPRAAKRLARLGGGTQAVGPGRGTVQFGPAIPSLRAIPEGVAESAKLGLIAPARAMGVEQTADGSLGLAEFAKGSADGALFQGCSEAWATTVLAIERPLTSSDSVYAGFSAGGRQLRLLPTTLAASAGEIYVPGAFVRVEPLGFRSRLLRGPQGWAKVVQTADVLEGVFQVWLPPLLCHLSVDEVVVTLATTNRGANIRWELALAEPDVADGKRLQATSRGGNKHVFSNLGGAWGAASDGCLKLVLSATQKLKADPRDVERANAWKIQDLQVNVRGSLEERYAGEL